MKRLFGYVRVSTARQGEGVSLQEQRSAILRHAAKTGDQIVRWFEEKQTAAKRGRAAFNAMVQLLRERAADGVVIHKIDRSARNLRDWADLGELIDSGIEIHFANEPLDLHSRGGRLSADILAVVAADFIRNNREETKKGFYGRLKQGLYPMRAPIGYLDSGGGKPKTIDPLRGPLVRHAFELYAAGTYSQRSLRSELTRLGLTNHNGSSLTMAGISVILNNPFYAGLIRIRKTGETFQGVHEPLVSTEVFQRVRIMLSGRTPARVAKHDFAFSRSFSCGKCGYSLVASRAKGKVYYRCYLPECVTTSVREDRLDEAIKQVLNTIRLPVEVVSAINERLDVRAKSLETLVEGRRQVLGTSLALVQRRISRLSDLYLDGELDRGDYANKREELLTQRRGIEEQLASLPSRIAGELTAARKIFELTKRPDLLFESAGNAEKRTLLHALTCNRQALAKKVAISLSPPFDRLAPAVKSAHGAPYRNDLRTLDGLIDIVLERLRDEKTNVQLNNLISIVERHEPDGALTPAA